MSSIITNLTSLPEKALEEISLDGADGTTIKALWIRLENRLTFDIQQDQPNPDQELSTIQSLELKKILKKVGLHKLILKRMLELTKSDTITFYKLPAKRPDPIIFNRFIAADKTDMNKIGCTAGNAPDETDSIEMVQFTPINPDPDVKGNISSPSRVLLEPHEINVDWLLAQDQQSIILVANEETRVHYLSKDNPFARSAINTLSEMEYIIFEYISRARYQGCIQSFLNKSIFNEQDSHINYQIKTLVKMNLITKQNYAYYTSVKENNSDTVLKERAISQVLLIHKRFHREMRNKQENVAKLVVDYLKTLPEKKINSQELKKESGLPTYSFKKLNEYLIEKNYCTQVNLRTDGKRAITFNDREIRFENDVPDSQLDTEQFEEDELDKPLKDFILAYQDKFLFPRSFKVLDERFQGKPQYVSLMEHILRIFTAYTEIKKI